MALPTREDTEQEVPAVEKASAPVAEVPQTPSAEEPEPEPQSEVSTIAAPSEPETPATSQAPSESDFTNSTVTPAHAPVPLPKPTPTQQQSRARRDTRTAIAVPSIPGLARPKDASPPSVSQKGAQSQAGEEATLKPEEQRDTIAEEASPVVDSVKPAESKPALKSSWADMVKRNAPKGPPPARGPPKGDVVTNGFHLPKSASLADALKQYTVDSGTHLNFLEPRGLVNTGNMCYMNSVRSPTTLFS